jgi:hypothetical protein
MFPVGRSPTLLPLLNHITHFRTSMALDLSPTVYFPRCLLHWKENQSLLKLRYLMHLSIITSYLAIAGLKTSPRYENVGVGLLKDSTSMGTFLIPPPDVPPPLVASINMISSSVHNTPASSDPWVIPELGDYLRYGDQMPLSLVESAYQAIQSETPSTPSLGDSSPDPFHVIFPTDEMIMSIMSMEDTPWHDGHHRSILFLEQHTIESYQWISTSLTVVVISSIPESTHDVLYEGNLSNISPTIPLDISIKPGVVENVHIKASCSTDEVFTYKSLFQEFHDIFSWSYEEMSSIDPDIVVHEIKTFPSTKPVWQRLCSVHPCKKVAIKLEVEKIL